MSELKFGDPESIKRSRIKKFRVIINLSGVQVVEVEAENEKVALEKADDMADPFDAEWETTDCEIECEIEP
jgi:hypothetical protein